MDEKISILNIDTINKNIKTIMLQTNYTEDEARHKLALFDYDYMRVLKDYMGIPEKEIKRKSTNQEIYTQIRLKLDGSMKEYREKHPIDLNQVITNLRESDEREKYKN